MIKNIQKSFILIAIFLVINNALGAENQMSLQDLVPFLEKVKKAHEELQVLYSSQKQTIQTQDETIKFLQTENQTHTNQIAQLITQHNEHDKTITELLNTTKSLVTAVETLTQNTQEFKQARININSPTGNNNHNNMVIQNTRLFGSVITATNGSSVSTGPSGKILFRLAILAGIVYGFYKMLQH